MPFGRAVHVFIARHRRGLAALLAALAVWLIAGPRPDEQSPGVPVLTAAQALAGGSTLTSASVRVVQAPAGMVPAGALTSVDQAAGQTVVADRPTGSILTRSDLLSAPRAGPGRALTAIRISDTAPLAMLRVGQTVNVVVAGEADQIRTLASSAVVRSILSGSALTGSGSGPLAAGGDIAVIVVSTDPTSAARIASHASSESIGIVMT